MLETIALTAAAYSLRGSEVIDLPRTREGVDYQLYVYTAEPCRLPDARCPVIYTLDAEYSFPVAAAVVEHLAARGGMQPAIVVSVGYRDKANYRPNRTRDYTPWPVQADSADPNYRGSGQAATFARNLADVIIPAVEARYHPQTSGRTIVGHSYGGLFAAYVRHIRPGLFDNYLIVSPSLWYDDGHMITLAASGLAGTKDRPSRVFIAVGELEEQPQAGRPMVSQARTFAAIVGRDDPSRGSSRFAVLSGETHASVFPSALSTGLRWLLPAPEVPVSP